MKNIQRIILWMGYVAVILLAKPVPLQAQTPAPPYTSGDLLIVTDDGVPSNISSITHITGALDIGAEITQFPDFAALKVVEGSLAIGSIVTALNNINDAFPHWIAFAETFSSKITLSCIPFRVFPNSIVLEALFLFFPMIF